MNTDTLDAAARRSQAREAREARRAGHETPSYHLVSQDIADLPACGCRCGFGICNGVSARQDDLVLLCTSTVHVRNLGSCYMSDPSPSYVNVLRVPSIHPTARVNRPNHGKKLSGILGSGWVARDGQLLSTLRR